MAKFLTFHKVLPGCEEGNPEAWKHFLADYTPFALHFLGLYSTWPAGGLLDCWRGALGALGADECAAMKGLSHQSEREFLVGMRAFLQDWAATKLVAADDAAYPAAPARETLDTLLKGLPLLHQEIVFLSLAGYSQASLEKLLRTTPTVAMEGLARLRTGYASLLERSVDRCLWPAAWLGICQAARATEQKDCTPVRQLIRILDGQASWYDKSPAEDHRSKCLHCLERWTSLLEVVAWDRARKPGTEEDVELLLKALPLKPETRKSSFFARMVGR